VRPGVLNGAEGCNAAGGDDENGFAGANCARPVAAIDKAIATASDGDVKEATKARIEQLEIGAVARERGNSRSG
jgi:hypothetical protein